MKVMIMAVIQFSEIYFPLLYVRCLLQAFSVDSSVAVCVSSSTNKRQA